MQRTSRLTGLWVDSVNASDSEHVADIPCLRRASKADWQCGLTFSCDGRSHSDGGAPIAVGVLLDRLRHVDFVVAQNAGAHHAVLELTADSVGWVEQTFHAFNQTSVSSWVNRCVAWRHHSSVFVQLLLSLQQNERSRWGGARRTNCVSDCFVCVSNVSIDARSQLRNTRLQNTLCEVIQLHGEFGGGEVHTDVLLGSHGQGGELFVVVLNLQGGAVGHQSAVWYTNTQSRANFCAFNGERVVVLTVNVTSDYQVVLEDFESLTGNHVDGKNRVCHDLYPKKS